MTIYSPYTTHSHNLLFSNILLSIIHELGEADTHDILNYIMDTKDWKYTNIETFMNRLWEKGYTTRERHGRRFRYKPKKTLSEVVFEVLDKLFLGTLRDQPAPLINYICSPQKLTEREINLLKQELVILKQILSHEKDGNEPPSSNEDGNDSPPEDNTESPSQ